MRGNGIVNPRGGNPFLPPVPDGADGRKHLKAGPSKGTTRFRQGKDPRTDEQREEALPRTVAGSAAPGEPWAAPRTCPGAWRVSRDLDRCEDRRGRRRRNLRRARGTGYGAGQPG